MPFTYVDNAAMRTYTALVGSDSKQWHYIMIS